MIVIRFLAKTILSIIGLILIFIGYLIGLIANIAGVILYILTSLLLIEAIYSLFAPDFTSMMKIAVWAVTVGMAVLSIFIKSLPTLLSSTGSYLIELIDVY